MREAGCRSPAHVAAVSMGKKEEAAIRGSSTGLLELVSHHSLCPLEQCSDATFQEDRKSQEFNTIIPSDQLVLSLGHPEPAAISGQEPKLSKPLSQTLSPLRKWEGNRERKEGRKAGRQTLCCGPWAGWTRGLRGQPR
jgi:hypothetical protein|eukprot:Gregarina_sp_Poly_1__7972@NODE_4564_length_556_cov_2_809816_g3078_i0_p1_GENE_NODE_4564_length_556_cov_2_809816_g3078_i0NODE_4564_length_556_cov_2_809816_g3078_i0_p1_ORF_typecomplete_len138_score12_74_NODE_4564_length_556_cov_2_809816_g3078_i0100513